MHEVLVNDALTTSLIESAGYPTKTFGFCSFKLTLKGAWDLCKECGYTQLLITDIDRSIMGVLIAEEILQYAQKD